MYEISKETGSTALEVCGKTSNSLLSLSLSVCSMKFSRNENWVGDETKNRRIGMSG